MKPKWINVKVKPDDSRAVLVTDGKDLSIAHWFNCLLKPPDYKIKHPGEWCNQHDRLTGPYIENITHWMDIEDLAELLLKGLNK